MINEHPINEHLSELRRYAMSLTRNAVDADDVVQDSVERALRVWASYDPARGPLHAWLRRIVHNQFCNRYRRVQRRAEIDLGTELHRGRSGDLRLDVAALEAGQEINRRFKNAQMKAEWCEVLVRREMHGEAYSEIAVAMGTPTGTVMSRLHRARAAMRLAGRSAGVDLTGGKSSEVEKPDPDTVDSIVRHRD